jgi:hypothetical protein
VLSRFIFDPYFLFCANLLKVKANLALLPNLPGFFAASLSFDKEFSFLLEFLIVFLKLLVVELLLVSNTSLTFFIF